MNEALLEVSGLSVSGGPARILDEVELTVAPGEIVGLVGESGCGKTTTALSLLGLLPPGLHIDGGEIRWRGKNLARAPERSWRALRGRELALVQQEPAAALNPVRNVGAQLASVFRDRLGLDRRRARERVAELLRQVGMPDTERTMERFPHELSGGQCQRVVIARALGCEPDLLLADEPASALDTTTQAQALALIGSLARERGAAVVLISHDLGLVAGYCDRVAVMYCGRIVESAPVDDLYARPAHPYTRALLGTLPRLDTAAREPIATIPGSVPAANALPPGCHFAPRCPRATDVCRESRPPLEPAVGGPGLAACFHPHGSGA